MTNLKTFDYQVPGQCNDFSFGTNNPPRTPIGDIYATEHILELQMVAMFLDEMNTKFGKTFPKFKPGATGGPQDLCGAIRELWTGVPEKWLLEVDGVRDNPIDHIMTVFPGNGNPWVNEFVLLVKGVNTAKEGVSTHTHIYMHQGNGNEMANKT